MTNTDLVHTSPIDGTIVVGAVELEPTVAGVRPHRLPAWARTQAADGQIAMAESQPAGVRLVFDTEARTIELTALATRYAFRGMPARPAGVFDLLVDDTLTHQTSLETATTITVDPATGSTDVDTASARALRFSDLPARRKRIELWLPHNETIDLVALRADAPIEPATRARPVWLHHGSSISHGSNATHPTGTWVAAAARAADVDLVNLGFGGSALLDPFTARVMRDSAADLISLKVGINIVNADLMRRRAFGPAVHGFLDTIREGHPDTPLLVVSPIWCAIHEETPGPGAFDPEAAKRGEVRFIATGEPAEVAQGKLTLRVIRTELERIVAQRGAHDPNLHYLDGRALYGEADAVEHPLPDALHPDSATHALMAERFDFLRTALGN